MKKIKILNIILCLIAMVCAWLSPAQLVDKLFITWFFTVVILFWIAAGKRTNNKLTT